MTNVGLKLQDPASSDEASHVLSEVRGQVGLITLNRPRALNALSLSMIRALTQCLLAWRDDARVKAVAIRGSNKSGPFGAFCAGGDIRFFHQAALAGDPALEDFFTEEYALNHLIHSYPKPFVAFMDGIVMGGGMGIAQGAKVRIVTQRTKMAMPETNIGWFPDVGGGYFLSRCPGHTGEWLALTGEILGPAAALALGLADVHFDATELPSAWEALAQLNFDHATAIDSWVAMYSIAAPAYSTGARGQIDHYFGLDSVAAMVQALEADADEWAQATAVTLRQRSPLMLQVTLEQIRRARSLSLADDLRMERDMVHHCFAPRHLGCSAGQSETVEGIRALAVDKDNTPHWNPARIEDVTPAMVAPFFSSPWTPQTHPLRALK
ncbi:MAG: enoyl-CoA hydratase/isomerase family protein [Rhodoferax sp.]|uniref:enoyl-CoA hydratase/isomerase family protein n=1 Tax=Rhodoferax sp. TaxID=50421 RepID=UPI0013FEEB85|nr:enoyl-CoA hydratase/isomerase family protein [Rhodoferax sp.]NDP39828.1 enoyl-CoA hydratase/isomerase family protein [Rhodoferax sp.]